MNCASHIHDETWHLKLNCDSHLHDEGGIGNMNCASHLNSERETHRKYEMCLPYTR